MLKTKRSAHRKSQFAWSPNIFPSAKQTHKFLQGGFGIWIFPHKDIPRNPSTDPGSYSWNIQRRNHTVVVFKQHDVSIYQLKKTPKKPAGLKHPRNLPGSLLVITWLSCADLGLSIADNLEVEIGNVAGNAFRSPLAA